MVIFVQEIPFHKSKDETLHGMLMFIVSLSNLTLASFWECQDSLAWLSSPYHRLPLWILVLYPAHRQTLLQTANWELINQLGLQRLARETLLILPSHPPQQ